MELNLIKNKIIKADHWIKDTYKHSKCIAKIDEMTHIVWHDNDDIYLFTNSINKEGQLYLDTVITLVQYSNAREFYTRFHKAPVEVVVEKAFKIMEERHPTQAFGEDKLKIFKSLIRRNYKLGGRIEKLCA
jgi:hypothetical protein